MTPVKQTLFADHNSNCLQAAVASVLDLDITEVPNFCELPVGSHPNDPVEWFPSLCDWARTKGYGVVYMTPASWNGTVISDGSYCVVCGPSPRPGLKHAVVGQMKTHLNQGQAEWNIRPVFDPHPSNNYLGGTPDYILLFTRGEK